MKACLGYILKSVVFDTLTAFQTNMCVYVCSRLICQYVIGSSHNSAICRSVYLNIPFLITMNVLLSLVGLVIYAHFADVGCDPLRSRVLSSPNQVGVATQQLLIYLFIMTSYTAVHYVKIKT